MAEAAGILARERVGGAPTVGGVLLVLTLGVGRLPGVIYTTSPGSLDKQTKWL
jgi:hypothetical protein